MKSMFKTAPIALAAILSGMVTLAAPAAFAQESQQRPYHGQMEKGPHAGGPQQQRFDHRGGRPGDNDRRAHGPRHGGPRGGGLMSILSFERGAEALEVALVRVSHRLDLTDAQKPLFEELRTTALAAQADFAKAYSEVRPPRGANRDAATAPTPRTPTQMIQGRIDVLNAQTAALSSVLPKFDAFYTSLTDEQKAQLEPRRGGRDNNRKGHMSQRGPNDLARPGRGAPAAEQPATPVEVAPAAPGTPLKS